MNKKQAFTVCAVYCAIILFFSSALILTPKKDFSPNENRMLSKMPRLSAESLVCGEFTQRFASFCSDHLAFRDPLLSLNSSFELGLGKLEVGNVMKGRNHNLIKRLEYNDYSKLEENIKAVEKIRGFANSHGAKSIFFCAPRSVDVLCDFCPPLFDTPKSDEVWEHVKNAETVNELLRKRANEGEYVFYKTDHHWTTLGAYYAYRGLGEKLNFKPYALSDFEAETVCENFYGTTYSSSLLPRTSPDKITAFRYEEDTTIKLTDMSTGKELPLYDYNAIEGSSKYDFFLGGNRAWLRVESQDKPRLVLVKDSFANSLVPFLARHFNIDVIDPRYLREPLDVVLTKLYEGDEKPTLLLLFGVDTLAGDVGLE